MTAGSQKQDLFFSNLIFLLIIEEFHKMYPDHTHFPVSPSPPSTLAISPKRGKRWRKRGRGRGRRRGKNTLSPVRDVHTHAGPSSNLQWPATKRKLSPSLPSPCLIHNRWYCNISRIQITNAVIYMIVGAENYLSPCPELQFILSVAGEAGCIGTTSEVWHLAQKLGNSPEMRVRWKTFEVPGF